MNLYNIKHPEQQVSFSQAVRQGLGKDQGLFFPEVLPKLENINDLLDRPLVERSQKILSAIIGDEIPTETLNAMVKNAFTFPAPLAKVEENIYALELFHGPTLAFKDFGGRFMAQALAVILYPKGKISPLQEKLFCTLGGNIRTVAINGDFDACQALVKQAFDDVELREAIGLNSANSINISRLLAQICYYFEAVAQLPKEKRDNLVVSVPSGNFGNLTAGLIAKTLGLPIKRFIASTNANDTVPRYLQSGNWAPKATVATLSNAMDVSRPNNWPRVEELFKRNGWNLADLGSGMLTDAQTEETLKAMYAEGYVCEPHGAIAYQLLKDQLKAGETGIFLCTAHPAKFKESVERILGLELPLPEALDRHNKLPLLSDEMENDFAQLRAYLLK